jgi:hypothetical protein
MPRSSLLHSKEILSEVSYQSSSDYWGGDVSYEPGLMFRLRDNVLLQASFGPLASYSYQKTDTGSSHSVSMLGGRNTDNLSFAVNFLF